MGGVADNSNRKRQETSKGKRAHARHKVTARVCVCVFVCVRARLRFGSCQFLALITGKENTYFERSFEALGVTDLQRQVCAVCFVYFCVYVCMCTCRLCVYECACMRMCTHIYVRICVNMYICIQEGTTPNDPATTGFLPLSLSFSLTQNFVCTVRRRVYATRRCWQCS